MGAEYSSLLYKVPRPSTYGTDHPALVHIPLHRTPGDLLLSSQSSQQPSSAKGSRIGHVDSPASRDRIDSGSNSNSARSEREYSAALSVPALYFPYTADEAWFTILYAHGRGEDAGANLQWLQILRDSLHANVLAVEYLGYGNTGGIPSENSLVTSVRRGMEWLMDEQKTPSSRVIFYGRNLGCGPVVEVASEQYTSMRSQLRLKKGSARLSGRSGVGKSVPLLQKLQEVAPAEFDGLGGLVLVSPFTSVFDVIHHSKLGSTSGQVDLFPNGSKKMAKVPAPVLVACGRDEKILPRAHAQKFYKRSGATVKRLVELSDCIDTGIEDDDDFLDALLSFVDGLMPEGKTIISKIQETPKVFSQSPSQVVADWLGGFGMQRYTDHLLAYGCFDMMVIASLMEEDLPMLGIEIPEHRDRIWAQIGKLREATFHAMQTPHPEPPAPAALSTRSSNDPAPLSSPVVSDAAKKSDVSLPTAAASSQAALNSISSSSISSHISQSSPSQESLEPNRTSHPPPTGPSHSTAHGQETSTPHSGATKSTAKTPTSDGPSTTAAEKRKGSQKSKGDSVGRGLSTEDLHEIMQAQAGVAVEKAIGSEGGVRSPLSFTGQNFVAEKYAQLRGAHAGQSIAMMEAHLRRFEVRESELVFQEAVQVGVHDSVQVALLRGQRVAVCTHTMGSESPSASKVKQPPSSSSSSSGGGGGGGEETQSSGEGHTTSGWYGLLRPLCALLQMESARVSVPVAVARLSANSVSVVYPYYRRGSLYGYLRRHRASSVALATRVHWCLQLAQGLSYLHAQDPPMVHGDLTSRHVFFAHRSEAVIGQFGLYRAPSLLWLAPEHFVYKAASPASDVYSLAIVFWEILTGRVPFHGTPAPVAALMVAWENRRPPLPPPEKFDPEVQPIVEKWASLLTHMWRADPHRRMPAADVAQVLSELYRAAAALPLDKQVVSTSAAEDLQDAAAVEEDPDSPLQGSPESVAPRLSALPDALRLDSDADDDLSRIHLDLVALSNDAQTILDTSKHLRERKILAVQSSSD